MSKSVKKVNLRNKNELAINPKMIENKAYKDENCRIMTLWHSSLENKKKKRSDKKDVLVVVCLENTKQRI
jgi:lysophospholipid acyltransferase (LPLAT)-like uncharacterized protein